MPLPAQSSADAREQHRVRDAYGIAFLLVLASTLTGGGDRTSIGIVLWLALTLATLGYGDVSPASYVVRALSVAEATIGQIYLVSVVAFAVGRLGGSIVRSPEEGA
ncbi:MAG: hypothetical protein K0B85_06890 [Coriobacteriia bacterium]|nr:hypothetical protein [Coriobacteriia bacterium]